MRAYSASVKEKIFNVTNGRCYYCGCKLDFNNFQVDHVLPRSKNGADKNNRVPSCSDCNIIKNNHTEEEFKKILESYFKKDIHVRMISKYLSIKEKPINFYFEKHNFEPF